MTVIFKPVIDGKETEQIYRNVLSVRGTDDSITIDWKEEGEECSRYIHTARYCAGYGCDSFTYILA